MMEKRLNERIDEPSLVELIKQMHVMIKRIINTNKPTKIKTNEQAQRD